MVSLATVDSGLQRTKNRMQPLTEHKEKPAVLLPDLPLPNVSSQELMSSRHRMHSRDPALQPDQYTMKSSIAGH